MLSMFVHKRLCATDVTKTDLLFDRQTVLCGLPSKFVSEEKKNEKISVFGKYNDIFIKRQTEQEVTLFPSSPCEKRKQGERTDCVFREQFSCRDLSITQRTK